MVDNVSTNTAELKELMLSMRKDMLDMKHDIMVKLTENQKDIQEIKDELKTLKTLKSTVGEVETATQFHSDKIHELLFLFLLCRHSQINCTTPTLLVICGLCAIMLERWNYMCNRGSAVSFAASSASCGLSLKAVV